MPIPFSYSLRNLWTRRLTTVLTAAGMALVVFVFAATLMLAEGLRKTLIETGSADNAVVIRKSSVTEVQSGVERAQAAIVASRPEIAIDADGQPLLAKEMVVLINLPRRESGKPANVVIRGTGPASLRLRPQVVLKSGRLPRPGSAEVMAGASIARRFRGGGLGETLRFGMRDWTVVGVFEAGATGFNSEIWGDVDQLMQAFRRPVYSSVLFRLSDPGSFTALKEQLENDPRLTLEAKRETRFYADQSEAMATFLSILGLTLTVIFSIGAIIGAMITMYAAVANRTTEIGTLRALGFSRGSVLAAFVAESLLLGLVGGIAGVLSASLLQLLTISTMNWQTFAELAFGFSLTVEICWKSLLFALCMGLVGGVLPALRAARLQVVDALRAT
ncbi:MAG: multidrug ABC transporter permease [Desulfuromonadales bacterium GWC2_61_20]|nr:MAG: multidrug ABC transporter permease [Desulfuromonadales bacterium GWC2_61_20]HAD05021.1 multidrug ABC transporter permease [Desulfuromonas sp.]HBT83033.1 multidrug ABC transporter permease [Desulfuromonas sp.]